MLKSIVFLVKSFLGDFYRHLAIFSGHTVKNVCCSIHRILSIVCAQRVNESQLSAEMFQVTTANLVGVDPTGAKFP